MTPTMFLFLFTASFQEPRPFAFHAAHICHQTGLAVGEHPASASLFSYRACWSRRVLLE